VVLWLIAPTGERAGGWWVVVVVVVWDVSGSAQLAPTQDELRRQLLRALNAVSQRQLLRTLTAVHARLQVAGVSAGEEGKETRKQNHVDQGFDADGGGKYGAVSPSVD
jgi:hypothetical protein